MLRPTRPHAWSLANCVPAKPAEERKSRAHPPSLEPVLLQGSTRCWGTCDPSCPVPTEIPPREAEQPALTPVFCAPGWGSLGRAPRTEVPTARVRHCASAEGSPAASVLTVRRLAQQAGSSD